jgi:hypothetical protein
VPPAGCVEANAKDAEDAKVRNGGCGGPFAVAGLLLHVGVGADAALFDEVVDVIFEDGERDGPEFEDGVVEGTDVELRAEGCFGFMAGFLDRELAEVVGDA